MRILVSLLFIFLLFDAYSQTLVSGMASGTWTKEKSPYLVNGDITISTTESVIIGPGVKVVFQGHYKFDVAGKLLALGNRNDSIIFTVNDTLGFSNTEIPDGSWNGININQETAKNVLINHCVFEYAKALNNDAGGAIELKKLYGPVEILNSSFRNNVSYAGGAVFYYGLGSSAYSLITIKNCSFYNNYAKNRGGALSISSFGALKELSNCRFIHNKAGSTGGAISIEAAQKIFNCLFKNNSATLSGGAVWNGVSTSLKIYNSIFDHNSAKTGAAYYANAGVFSGLYNCTLINNVSSHSSVYTGTNTVGEFTIVNTIVWNPGSPEVILSSATTRKTVQNSIIRNAQDSTWFSSTCMNINPLLSVDPITEYAPLEGSPCIEKGNNSYLDPAILVDFNNNCRLWDGKNTSSKTVDIGAIEFNSVDSLPKMKNNLHNDTLCEGSELLLELSTANEVNNNTYQWFYNGQALTGSSPSLSIKPATENNSGYYFCRISNKFGEIQSNAANILLVSAPQQPSRPSGTENIITNIADSSLFKIPEIEKSFLLQWELSPSVSGKITFNDTMAVVKWNNTYQGKAALVVKHSNNHCYSLSDTLYLTVDPGPSAVQKPRLFAPKIYPNPSSGDFFIDFTGLEHTDSEIIITDFLGRVVRRESVSDTNAVRNYKMPQGIYHIVLKSGNKLLSANKIVVN